MKTKGDWSHTPDVNISAPIKIDRLKICQKDVGSLSFSAPSSSSSRRLYSCIHLSMMMSPKTKLLHVIALIPVQPKATKHYSKCPHTATDMIVFKEVTPSQTDLNTQFCPWGLRWSFPPLKAVSVDTLCWEGAPMWQCPCPLTQTCQVPDSTQTAAHLLSKSTTLYVSLCVYGAAHKLKVHRKDINHLNASRKSS